MGHNRGERHNKVTLAWWQAGKDFFLVLLFFFCSRAYADCNPLKAWSLEQLYFFAFSPFGWTRRARLSSKTYFFQKQFIVLKSNQKTQNREKSERKNLLSSQRGGKTRVQCHSQGQIGVTKAPPPFHPLKKKYFEEKRARNSTIPFSSNAWGKKEFKRDYPEEKKIKKTKPQPTSFVQKRNPQRTNFFFVVFFNLTRPFPKKRSRVVVCFLVCLFVCLFCCCLFILLFVCFCCWFAKQRKTVLWVGLLLSLSLFSFSFIIPPSLSLSFSLFLSLSLPAFFFFFQPRWGPFFHVDKERWWAKGEFPLLPPPRLFPPLSQSPPFSPFPSLPPPPSCLFFRRTKGTESDPPPKNQVFLKFSGRKNERLALWEFEKEKNELKMKKKKEEGVVDKVFIFLILFLFVYFCLSILASYLLFKQLFNSVKKSIVPQVQNILFLSLFLFLFLFLSLFFSFSFSFSFPPPSPPPFLF